MSAPDWRLVEKVRPYVLPEIFTWLADEASLTARLKARCGEQFRLTCHREVADVPSVPEAAQFPFLANQPIFLREVTLGAPTVCLVYARSLFAPALLAKKREHATAEPLGEWLFCAPDCTRGPIFAAELTAQHALFDAARAYLPASPTYWARYSIFEMGGVGLPVYEVFYLPDICQ